MPNSSSIDQGAAAHNHNHHKHHQNNAMGNLRPSFEGDSGQGALGGLIDVRPKVLHSNVAGQDVRKSHHGKTKDSI